MMVILFSLSFLGSVSFCDIPYSKIEWYCNKSETEGDLFYFFDSVRYEREMVVVNHLSNLSFSELGKFYIDKAIIYLLTHISRICQPMQCPKGSNCTRPIPAPYFVQYSSILRSMLIQSKGLDKLCVRLLQITVEVR